VTVALDTDVEAARRHVERAAPAPPAVAHPSLVDAAHVVDELFGIVNVPNAVWIDETGMIVRPAEPAHPGRNPETESFRTLDASTLPDEIARVLLEARKIRTEPERYLEMLHDWVEHGASSRYALSPDEVVARADRRSDAEARAAAHFELGQHCEHAGAHDAAVRHWREAHRLAPANWTYKRNAWSIEDPRQGPTEVYESSWFEDVKAIGAENYYPPIVP
jgi:hypothetical protein